MLLRSLVGSLAVVGALGALAAALPEHKKQASVRALGFGALPTTSPATLAAGQTNATEAEKQSLIKLAAYSTPSGDANTPAPAAPVSRDPAIPSMPRLPAWPVGPTTATAPEPVTALQADKTGVPADGRTSAVSTSPTQPGETQPLPQTLAALTPTPPSAPPAPVGTGRVNINRASVDALDHLPGGGRIGVAIARRRPYAAVDDLVRKRVLRAGIFARIRSAITVD